MRKIYKIGIGVVIAVIAVFLVYFGVGIYQQIQNEQQNRFEDAVISSNLSQEEIDKIIFDRLIEEEQNEKITQDQKCLSIANFMNVYTSDDDLFTFWHEAFLQECSESP